MWEVEYDKASDRISARRKRISSRLDAAKRLSKLIKVQQLFGHSGTAVSNREDLEVAEDRYVENQCRRSRVVIGDVLENGNELVGNIRLASDHIFLRHRAQIERREKALHTLMARQEKETLRDLDEIKKNWPVDASKKRAPTDLFAKILNQKDACNDLLEKKNDLIATLEEEIKDADNEYKLLIEKHRENVSVLASRMESQIQALEGLVAAERTKIETALEKQATTTLERNEKAWTEQLDALNTLSERRMEERLQLLSDNERDLDTAIIQDSEAFTDMKHALEETVQVLADQLLFIDALQDLNEERLDYEIHVLRKHEEEIVLVKSEQKRAITNLQDNINRLRQRQSRGNQDLAKEETQIQSQIEEVRKKLVKLRQLDRTRFRQSVHKQKQIVEMLRDDVGQRLERLVARDAHIRKTLVSIESPPVALFLQPLFGSRTPSLLQLDETEGCGLLEKRPDASTAIERSTDAEATDSRSTRLALSNFIHEAGFLVEENLSQLVGDIDEKERELFKLDSILSALGIEAESDMLEILRRYSGTGEPGSAQEAQHRQALSALRSHLEHSETGKSELAATRTAGRAGRTRAEAFRSLSTGDEHSQWERMIASIEKGLLAADRHHMLEELKSYNRSLVEVGKLQKEVARMNVHASELKEIACKMEGISLS